MLGQLSKFLTAAATAVAAAAACCQVHGVELLQTDLVAGLMPRLAGVVDLLVRPMLCCKALHLDKRCFGGSMHI
jgi:hypothetical protein